MLYTSLSSLSLLKCQRLKMELIHLPSQRVPTCIMNPKWGNLPQVCCNTFFAREKKLTFYFSFLFFFPLLVDLIIWKSLNVKDACLFLKCQLLLMQALASCLWSVWLCTRPSIFSLCKTSTVVCAEKCLLSFMEKSKFVAKLLTRKDCIFRKVRFHSHL